MYTYHLNELHCFCKLQLSEASCEITCSILRATVVFPNDDKASLYVLYCSVLTEANILPHLASHVIYDAKKQQILTEVLWVLTYLTAW